MTNINKLMQSLIYLNFRIEKDIKTYKLYGLLLEK